MNGKNLPDEKPNKGGQHWKANTVIERQYAVSLISRTINRHGYIISNNVFSDDGLGLGIEVRGSNIISLYTALSEFLTLEKVELYGFNPNKDITIFLKISFY